MTPADHSKTNTTTNTSTQSTDISSITLTRTESFDPLRVIEEATAQAAAERIAREHVDPANPEALTYRFEKDDQYEGCFIDLVIEGTDQKRLDLVHRRLQARGYELAVTYDSEIPELPDLVRISRMPHDSPASEERAREVLDSYGYAGPLDPQETPGLYRLILPENGLNPTIARLSDGNWQIYTISRR